MAFGFVLVASIVRSPAFHLAFVITTLSAAAGAPGVRVIVVVRVTPNHAAVMVTGVVALTADVVTGNAPHAWPPLTTVSAGTATSAGLLLESLTTAPSVVPLNRTVPVDALPPVTLAGLTDTDVRDAPAGVAAFTERLLVLGVLPTHAVIVTLVGGAAALVETVNVPAVDPAGMTTL